MNRQRDWTLPQLSCASHHITILKIVSNTAYWIAFGPHGPRALPPPGENWYIFRMTMLGVGISFIIFCAIRSMARPAPKTMNAQYQEMTNEYLKVCNAHERDPIMNLLISSFGVLNNIISAEPKNRTHHRCIIRGLRRQRNGAEQAKKRRHSNRRRRIISSITVVPVFYLNALTAFLSISEL